MRNRPSRYVHKSAHHKYRMELVLEFGEAVPPRQADEAARKILESLRINAERTIVPAEVEGCSLKCHGMRQIVSLIPPPKGEK